MSFCWECGIVLPVVVNEEEEGEEEVIKKRARKGKRCKKCANAVIVKRRHKDPLLQHRLFSIKTVREVWERCEKKSVISGETNPQYLCISYKHKEAQSLAHLSAKKRLSFLIMEGWFEETEIHITKAQNFPLLVKVFCI
jgi:hypothetical protein